MIFRILSCIGILIFLVACEEDLINTEFYKPFIYMKSEENNIFSYPHKMNDSLTTGYFTIGSGGSMALEEDIQVTIDYDEGYLEEYNYRYYGDETEKYAKPIPAERYIIPNYNVVIKAGDVGAATFSPIEIDVNGLSPDTTYMIPLKIISASGNEINPDKDFVLYQIDLVNDYSSIDSRTYKMRGTRQLEDGIQSNITSNKILLPLSKNEVRLYPENLSSSTNIADINERTIVLVINDDNSVRVKSYDQIKIQQVGEGVYDPEEKEFFIHYKYLLPDESKWTNITETLTRIE